MKYFPTHHYLCEVLTWCWEWNVSVITTIIISLLSLLIDAVLSHRH